MAKLKGPIYKEVNTQSCNELLEKLLATCQELDFVCRANEPISRGGTRVGYGVSESKKAIVCDTVISIVKEIKKIKGW
jgi:hypothetical protein